MFMHNKYRIPKVFVNYDTNRNIYSYNTLYKIHVISVHGKEVLNTKPVLSGTSYLIH